MGDVDSTRTVIDDDLHVWRHSGVQLTGEGAGGAIVTISIGDDSPLELDTVSAREVARLLLTAADHADAVAAS